MRHLQDRLKGCWTSLPTPFTGESIDEGAFARLVEWQVREGAHCLVVAGEVGEGSTLSDVERETLVWIAANVASGRVPIVAAILANGTERALAMMESAKQVGADAALVTVPYYNKPGQRGILAHIEALAHGTELPLLIHNAPERTVVDASADTLATLAGYRSVIGVVDHGASLGRLIRLRSSVPSGFMILAGDDHSGPLHRIVGGDGWLSRLPLPFCRGTCGNSIVRACRGGGGTLSNVSSHCSRCSMHWRWSHIRPPSSMLWVRTI